MGWNSGCVLAGDLGEFIEVYGNEGALLFLGVQQWSETFTNLGELMEM